MPELPEVETVTRQLRNIIKGKKIQSIEVLKNKSFQGEISNVVGTSIQEISRRSKIIRIQLSNNLNLLIHLKMSGQLIYVEGEKRVGGGHPTADWINELPSSHTRVFFTFSDGTKLFFNDQRIFGWIKVATQQEVDHEFQKLAPDIIDPAISVEYLKKRFKNRNVPIKQLIMDNQILSGVGNIYACDALNLAKISPLRPGNSLTEKEITTLLESMRTVINLGIELGGATAHGKYVHVSGLAGKYQNVMRVYSHKGDPCPNCGSKIDKIRLGGRGTFYCPNCQK
jgi:formamidopyrimidine-DNA glycosylase